MTILFDLSVISQWFKIMTLPRCLGIVVPYTMQCTEAMLDVQREGRDGEEPPTPPTHPTPELCKNWIYLLILMRILVLKY